MSAQTTFNSGQLAKFIGILAQEGVTPNVFQDFLESGIAGDIFSKNANLTNRIAICQAIGVDPEDRGLLFFELNYPLDLQRLYEKTGCWNQGWSTDGVPDVPIGRLPKGAETSVKYEARLFDFGKGVSNRNARRRIYNAGWEPAGHEHLLALLAKYGLSHKPIDPISGHQLIALRAPCVMAFTRASPQSGAFRVLAQLDTVDYCPPFIERHRYLGIRRVP